MNCSIVFTTLQYGDRWIIFTNRVTSVIEMDLLEVYFDLNVHNKENYNILI